MDEGRLSRLTDVRPPPHGAAESRGFCEVSRIDNFGVMDKEVARAARDIATRAALDMIATRGGARRTARRPQSV